ncbi:CRISPR-associated protein [Aeropyrum pernix]|uniref:CRISPR-associated protein n=1 Tax=Aeropyrum pernix TaxID=56636 RepID=A0A401HA93_AERPX|nr:hypothetical protein [Aeropyrum pernix]GBF09327.1 CRISPR-associated protein [Aeropyrum pernix]
MGHGSLQLDLTRPSAGDRPPSSLEETLKSARKLYSRTLESVGIYLTSAPLAAYYYSRSFPNAGEEPYSSSLVILNIIYDAIDNIAKVEDRGGVLSVEWKNALRLQPAKALIASAAIAQHVVNAVKQEVETQEGLALQQLEEINTRLSSPNKMLADEELSSIRDGCLKKKPTVVCQLQVSREWTDKECRVTGINKRNFYAHAGLEKNVTQLVERDGTLYLGYCPQAEERVMNVSKKIAVDILHIKQPRN